MYSLVFVAVVAFSAIVNCEDTYSSKFEKIDIDAIIGNERLLQNHFNCLLEGKGCTPEAEELKNHIPEIMETCCAKCTDKHKEGAKKLTQYLIDNKPDYIKQMLDKYDPDRKYAKKCSENLKDGGIDLSSF